MINAQTRNVINHDVLCHVIRQHHSIRDLAIMRYASLLYWNWHWHWHCMTTIESIIWRRRRLSWNNGGDCPREKLLLGRRPVRTRRTISSLILCRKNTFVLRKINKNCCRRSCTFWLQYAPNRLSAGASLQTPLGELTAFLMPPNCI